jgi:hypothetical protein
MSVREIRDPFEVVDAGSELAVSTSADERETRALETWLGRGLLLLAVALMLFVGIRLLRDTPNYRPDNEANRIAFIEQLATHGTPPVVGKDSYMIDPAGPLPHRTVALHRLTPGTAAVQPNLAYPQALGLDRPYGYYVAVPLTLVPWGHRVLALRLLSLLCACAAVLFLWAAVREAWPANPLAAGLSAIVLGTMSGLLGSLAVFDTDSLLVLCWCAGMWLALRDWRARRCSPWTVAAWTAAAGVSSLGVPVAIAVVVCLTRRADGPGRRVRAAGQRLAAVLAPTVLWVAWNLHAYGDPWPLNVSYTGPDRARDWGSLTQVLRPLYEVGKTLFDGLYASGIAPDRHLDERLPSLVAVLVAVALIAALVSGRISFARLPLARIGVLMLASFASVYATLFLASVVAGEPASYPASHFGGFAAAWAGVVGIALTTPLGAFRRLNLAACALVALALAAEMLRAPIL